MSQFRDMKLTMLRLRNGNPEAYDQFLSQFNDLTLDALKALADAPTDEILKHQGRCQQLRLLMRVFVDGSKTETASETKPTPE